jgi:hypothetical protein
MKIIAILIILGFFLSPVLAVDLSSSFRGTGDWSSSINAGTTKSEMSGQGGQISIATQGSFTSSGDVLKQGVEFNGTQGRMKIQNTLSDVIQNLQVKNANSISMRLVLDTQSKEETQDSSIGQLNLYNTAINAFINGSVAEVVNRGSIMGRPIELSTQKGTNGIWEINSSIKLNEYDNGWNNQ